MKRKTILDIIIKEVIQHLEMDSTYVDVPVVNKQGEAFANVEVFLSAYDKPFNQLELLEVRVFNRGGENLLEVLSDELYMLLMDEVNKLNDKTETKWIRSVDPRIAQDYIDKYAN